MANPFDSSRAFYKVGHITNTPPWKLLPTPNGLGLVTTTGRKTGKRRQRAMRVVREGNRAYAVALLGEDPTGCGTSAPIRTCASSSAGPHTTRSRANYWTPPNEPARQTYIGR